MVHVSISTFSVLYKFHCGRIHFDTCLTVQITFYTCSCWHPVILWKCLVHVSTLTLYRSLCTCPRSLSTNFIFLLCSFIPIPIVLHKCFSSVQANPCWTVQCSSVHLSTVTCGLLYTVLIYKCASLHLSRCTKCLWTRPGLAPSTGFYGAPVPEFFLFPYTVMTFALVPGCSLQYVLFTYCAPHACTCAETTTNDCAKCRMNDLLISHHIWSQKLELKCTVRPLIFTVRRVARRCSQRLKELQKLDAPFCGDRVKCLSCLRTRDTWDNFYGLGKEVPKMV